jgi:F0F1-type ATP synthase alpha subunit
LDQFLQVGAMELLVFWVVNAQYGELVQFDNGLEAIVLNLEEDNVGVVLLGPSTGIEGSTVKRTQRIASLNGRKYRRSCCKHTWRTQLMVRTNR